MFVRNRVLTFRNLMTLIGQGLKRSIQREMNDFFGRIENADYSIQKVTKGAFTQSRAKLNPRAFEELSEDTLRIFYDEAPYLQWRGYRLLACDGSTVQLPNHKTIKEEFGRYGYGPNADSEKSLGRLSMLYDVLNLTTLKATIAPLKQDERSLLYEHLETYEDQSNDLILLDRGYTSIALLFYLIHVKQSNFCVRMKNNWWKVVESMQKNGETDKIVTLKLPKKDQFFAEQNSIEVNQIQVRIVIFTLENGETEVLCTSLKDEKEYTLKTLKELYKKRWVIEEAYKLYKNRTELSCFSGKTALAIKQDFQANVLQMNLCATLTFPIEEKVRRENKIRINKHEKQVNRSNALSIIKESMVLFFIKNKTKQVLRNMQKILEKTCEIVRPNRSFKRKHKPKQSHHMNYKRL